MIITQHGYDFEIDTNDWSNSTSAEKAQGYIRDLIGKWTPEEAAANHAALINETGAVSTIQNAAFACGTQVMVEENWAERPISGHNTEISALEPLPRAPLQGRAPTQGPCGVSFSPERIT
tara:strand:+ start:1379 stop:1738 length:360 start_codon:yes stop_codon:yes gene_type:complete